MRGRDIVAELVRPLGETPTVALAAQALGCHEDQIIKSLLFLIKNDAAYDAVLVIANGASLVDRRKLAAQCGVGHKRIKLAPPGVVLALTGYPAGGVPPFGYPSPISTYVDRRVLGQAVVFGGGGDERTLLRITPQELLRVTDAQVVEVT